MTNMKASLFLFRMFVLQSMITVSTVHTGEYRINDGQTNRELQAITTEASILEILIPSWTFEPIRSKRSEEVGEETILTRHSKHKKRRRCKNRPSCSRATSANKSTPLHSNGTEHKTKNEDYDATETIEGKDVDNERFLADETALDKVDEDASSKTKGSSKKNEFWENADYKEEEFSSFSIEHENQMSESLSALLSKLFQNLRNASTSEDIFKELNFVNATNQDPCQKWLNSKDKLEKVFLGGLISLPACPCEYPSNIFYDDKIWDARQKKHFRWRDVSGHSQRLDIYKPGATYCIRSLLTQGSGSAAAQHCCYDRSRQLLTRGSGAGTPNFVSPEISPILHQRIDILPWRLCKGDFSRYNGVRPPNNDNGCKANPDDEEYQRQIAKTKYY